MRFLRRTRDPVDVQSAGAKAAALAELERAGFDVPPWAVVVPDAFIASLSASDRAGYAAARRHGRPFTVPAELKPARAAITEIERVIREICPDGELLAVRSSSIEEDGAERSFAGQLESFLFVSPSQIAGRLVAVWRSAFSECVLAYRRSLGLAIPGDPCAVLLQRMVHADAAGVAFSADPITGRRRVAVVSAAYGTGERLVGGHCQGQTWRVDRNGGILERIGMHARDGQPPVLDDAAVSGIAALARRTARHLRGPIDVEWAIAEGRMHLLQARPITALARRADPDGRVQLWDNSNIVESYAGVTTPLTYSFARNAYERVYAHFCRIAGVPQAVIADNAAMLGGMIGLIRGRVYYNLMNWYRLLSLIPGFRVNRRFMEQMMGVRQAITAQDVNTLAAGRGAGIVDLWRTLGSGIALSFAFLTLRRAIRRFHADVDDALKSPAIPLEEQEPDELAEYYRHMERRLLSRWGVPVINDLFAMIFQGVLRHLCTAWLNDVQVCGRLLECGRDVISIEPAARMKHLAELAAAHPGLVQRLASASASEIRESMRDAPDFEAGFTDYIEQFGDRCFGELKLESPTLRDDPLPLFRTVASIAAGMPVEGASENPRACAPRDAAGPALRSLPAFRRCVFAWILRHARARIRDRENLRYQRTRVFGLVRRIFVELGRRFAAMKLIGRPADIFYLEAEEILGFIEGTATCTRLNELAALRRSEFEQYRTAASPADRFETRGSVHHANIFDMPAGREDAAEGECRTGLGCSPGRVRGRVRVIRDPRESTPRPGEIIVAPCTDPGWVLIFPLAVGLVVERGSLLSHSAVVARELGLPAVVSVQGACAWLRDGDEIELDGATGRVRRLHAVLGKCAA